ncbi:Proteasome subunit alpha type-3 [Cricetulus griseus]|uniref:Proteasome subunit alpha type n=1 Tax=Cricetulus griseus TaxID=10029 RepID=G3I9G7_CRIGR|nr:Proteasome subunit alpha type-3 [Cricetulus griseus]
MGVDLGFGVRKRSLRTPAERAAKAKAIGGERSQWASLLLGYAVSGVGAALRAWKLCAASGVGTMSSIGTGYDLSASTFSPDGRVFQVEYAMKAVENSSTAIGIRCKDGVVFGVEKLVLSKLYEEGSNKRLFNVDRHVGMAVAGLLADARSLADIAREEASNFRSNFGYNIPLKGYWGCAIGKARQAAKTEIEKLQMKEMTCCDVVKEVAKIIYIVHDEVKDKAFELELSWVGELTKGRHEIVPKDIREEAEKYAKESLKEEDESDDDNM